jgi:hypothetical protein
MDISFLTALAAPLSCQKPSRLLISMIVRIIAALIESPRKNDSAPAKMSIRISGLLNCDSRRVRESDLLAGFRRLAPYCDSRFFASSSVRPFGVV